MARTCCTIFASAPLGRNRSRCCHPGEAACSAEIRAIGPKSSKLGGAPICCLLNTYAEPKSDSPTEEALRATGSAVTQRPNASVGEIRPSVWPISIRIASRKGVAISP